MMNTEKNHSRHWVSKWCNIVATFLSEKCHVPNVNKHVNHVIFDRSPETLQQCSNGPRWHSPVIAKQGPIWCQILHVSPWKWECLVNDKRHFQIEERQINWAEVHHKSEGRTGQKSLRKTNRHCQWHNAWIAWEPPVPCRFLHYVLQLLASRMSVPLAMSKKTIRVHRSHEELLLQQESLREHSGNLHVKAVLWSRFVCSLHESQCQGHRNNIPHKSWLHSKTSHVSNRPLQHEHTGNLWKGQWEWKAPNGDGNELLSPKNSSGYCSRTAKSCSQTCHKNNPKKPTERIGCSSQKSSTPPLLHSEKLHPKGQQWNHSQWKQMQKHPVFWRILTQQTHQFCHWNQTSTLMTHWKEWLCKICYKFWTVTSHQASLMTTLRYMRKLLPAHSPTKRTLKSSKWNDRSLWNAHHQTSPLPMCSTTARLRISTYMCIKTEHNRKNVNWTNKQNWTWNWIETKKMNGTRNWLDEIEHFCSLWIPCWITFPWICHLPTSKKNKMSSPRNFNFCSTPPPKKTV